MFHCSNLLSKNLGSKRGEDISGTPRASGAGGFGQDQAWLSLPPGCGPQNRHVLISGCTPALTCGEGLTPSKPMSRGNKGEGMCFPDVTHPVEELPNGASLLRLQSVYL